MLVSRFNLQNKEDEEALAEEETPATEPESVHEEEKPVRPERKLHKSEIAGRLSLLGKTGEGDGYAYLKVTCTDMKLTDISALKSYKHLQFVNLSNNFLKIEALQALAELPYLLLIHADNNALNTIALKPMKYLQVIIVNNNMISSIYDVYQPELSTLEAGNNNIQEVKFQNKMPTLKCLDFRNNFIKDIQNFDFPNLDSLYLAGNKITSLLGLEKLVNLRILHVRNNPIKNLNGFDGELKKLKYINLRNCKIATLKQVKKLRVLTGLETLVMKGCPYMGGTGEETGDVAEEDSETRVETLAALPRLKRINKEYITPEERTEANDLMKQWLEEGEHDEEEIGEEHSQEGSHEDD